MESGIRCRNCGHESHCGITLWKAVDKKMPDIEVCKTCRCQKCTRVLADWG